MNKLFLAAVVTAGLVSACGGPIENQTPGADVGKAQQQLDNTNTISVPPPPVPAEFGTVVGHKVVVSPIDDMLDVRTAMGPGFVDSYLYQDPTRRGHGGCR